MSLYSAKCESTIRQPNVKRAAFYPPTRPTLILSFSFERKKKGGGPSSCFDYTSPAVVVQHVNWAVEEELYAPGARSERGKKKRVATRWPFSTPFFVLF